MKTTERKAVVAALDALRGNAGPSELQTARMGLVKILSVPLTPPDAYRYKFRGDLQWQYTENKAQAHTLSIVQSLFVGEKNVN